MKQGLVIKTKLLCLALIMLMAFPLCIEAQNSQIGIRLGQISSNSTTFSPNSEGLMSEEFQLKFNMLDFDAFANNAIGNNTFIRSRLAFNRVSASGNIDIKYSNNEYYTVEAKASRTSFGLAPGIGKNMFSMNRALFYSGIELPLMLIGSSKIDVEYVESFEDWGGDIYKYTMSMTSELDGGFSVHLTPFLGFSYNLFGPLNLGAELYTGIGYTSTGGDLKLKYYEDGSLEETINLSLKNSSFERAPFKFALTITILLDRDIIQ